MLPFSECFASKKSSMLQMSCIGMRRSALSVPQPICEFENKNELQENESTNKREKSESFHLKRLSYAKEVCCQCESRRCDSAEVRVQFLLRYMGFLVRLLLSLTCKSLRRADLFPLPTVSLLLLESLSPTTNTGIICQGPFHRHARRSVESIFIVCNNV
ncbi:hypothetical protein SCHPADRAFT_745696 [Schizopora paradoxa]|uniref:Uncharacterized protein n=1 Tax=Schizopora paradoxa TaxID=27342 RepID=A0A0H2R0I2_9AGAM|nr:hypothetical protein SCHPADRAFT_745696 [Schizopora paradoxa]